MGTWYLTGTVNSGSSAEWQCRLVVTENSQDIVKNTSNITLTFQFGRKRSTSYSQNGSTTFTLSIGGTSYTGTKAAYNYSSMAAGVWYTIGTWTKTDVYHNADGTLNMPVGASWSQSGVSPSSCNVSGTITLPTIPRASSVHCNDAAIGSSTTITINRYSSNFTHTITYTFGFKSGTIATKTTNTAIGWTIPTDFYNAIPNSATGKCTITCTTYSGSTKIGSSTCTATFNTNNTSVSVGSSVEDVNSVTLALTGNKDVIVIGESNAKINTSVIPSIGASVRTITVKCSDKTGSGASCTINGVSSGTFSITATDSRGKSKTITINKTTIDYSNVMLVDASLSRPNTASSIVNITNVNINAFTGEFKTGSSNTIVFKYRYLESGSGTWSAYYDVSSSLTKRDGYYTASSIQAGDNLSPSSSYTFEFYVSDKLSSYSTTKKLSIAIPIIDIGKNDVKVNGEVYGNSFYQGSDKLLSCIHKSNYSYYKFYDGTGVYMVHHKCQDCVNVSNIPDAGSATPISGLQYVTCDYNYPSDVDLTGLISATVTMEGAGMGYWASLGDMFDRALNNDMKVYNARVYFTSNLTWSLNIGGHGVSFVIVGTWK